MLATGVRFSRTGGHNPLTGEPAWSKQNLCDTWIFDGENWQELGRSQYPNYVHQAMATDLQSGHVIVSGGIAVGPKTLIGVFLLRDRRESPLVDDTWIFNGENWQEIHPPISPSPRQGACITYDSMKGQIVLFGGKDANGYLNDTWILNLSG